MAPTPTGTPASSRSTRRRTMLLVTALVVVLAGATVLYTALTPARSSSGAAGAGPVGAPVSFTAATMSGQQVTVAGGKPSVLLFFGVTCGGCGPTATALGRFQRHVPGAANFVGVDITPGETDSDVRGFLTTDLGYAFDTNTRLIKALGVTQLTTVIVLDTSGTPLYRAVELTTAQVQTELAKLAAR